MAFDNPVKYCPKCGDIDYLRSSTHCMFCETPLEETRYIGVDVIERKVGIKPEIKKAIFEEYIKDNPLYSEEAVKKRKERQGLGVYVPKVDSKIKCPYCKSANVAKISAAGRVVSVGLFGLGSSKVGKQWHCNSCKSDF